jgi:hypothetical protein
MKMAIDVGAMLPQKEPIDTTAERRVAIAEVSIDLLAIVLGFPEDVRIVGVLGAGFDREGFVNGRALSLFLEGSSIPAGPDGDSAPRVTIVVTQHTDVENLVPKVTRTVSFVPVKPFVGVKP